MKKILFVLCLGLVSVAYGQNPCAPATGQAYLDLNNTSALIENGGSMWQDRLQGAAAYEIPKGTGETVIYSGSIWLGGLDVNNQLVLAGLKFRQGDDFYPGPLKLNDGTTYDSTCLEFDRVWKINRWQVEEFIQKYQDNTYTIPETILSWPAHGNTQQNYAQNLAPFHDSNNDGIYNPYDGDYPEFDLNNTLPCDANKLYGEQCIYYIMNDAGNSHTETGGDSIGVEIHAQAFAFRGTESLNNTTFYNYKIFNRSYHDYHDFYFANYTDMDIGCAEDDYVGCDVQRGLGYSYNGDAIDNNCSWAIGANPPAAGIDFIKGPLAPLQDGIDNDRDGSFDEPGERYSTISKFVYFDRTLNQGIFGDPNTAVQYYNYMKGLWRDNTPFVYGSTGNSSSSGATSILTDYCFPGDSDPTFFGTNGIDPGFDWGEQYPLGPGSAANPIGDRRMMNAVGPFDFNSGDTVDITFAAMYARRYSGDPYQSVIALKEIDDTIQSFADSCYQTNNCLHLVNDFKYQNSNLNFHFAYEMQADVYSWTFGDGNTSTVRFPTHTYAAAGTYNVCIIASKFNCSSIAYCKNVSNLASIQENTNKTSLFPNPTNDLITLDINAYNGPFEVEIYDLQGRLLETTKSKTVSLKKYSKGIYIFRVSYGNKTEEVRVLRQ